MEKLVLNFLYISFLITGFVTRSFTHPSNDRPRRSHGSGNDIFQAIREAVNEEAPATIREHQNEDPRLPSASFYQDITRKLSDLQANVDGISAQNGVLRQKLADSESRNQKLDLLVAKLEKLFGAVNEGDAEIDELTMVHGDEHDVDTRSNTIDGRLETLSEYLGNREAELVAYNPDSETSNKSSIIEELREELSDGARNTLDLLERSLVRLSERTGMIEADVGNLKYQITRGGPMHDVIERSANTIPERILPARSLNAGAQLPLASITEVDASRKVAFSAAATKSQYGSNVAQTVQFQDVMENSNEDFVASNHTFVCSVPGWYFFTYSLRTADGKYLGVLMMKNLNYLVGVYTDASDRNTMETQSTVVKLQAGDAVWLRLGPSSEYGLYSDTYRYSTFSGFLLFKS